MPFGRSKKDKDQDEDSKRSALFGRSGSKSSKPAPADTNPYAAVQAPSNDPYGVRQSQPPAYSGNGIRNDKSPVPPGGYGGAPPRSGYGGSSNYGQSGGYGDNPYGGSSSNQAMPAQAQRPGGYGGLGRSNSQDTVSTEAGRAALFGDAATRQQQRAPAGPQTGGQEPGYGQESGEGTDSSFAGGYNGYGGYQDRQLTAEEQEEEDVQAAKSEIRFIKQQDVASTRNARRIAEQAEQTGRETLARLGQQGERIHNAERNLDLASIQNRIAQEQASELKTLNRSMFAVHMSNPFTKSKRELEADALVLSNHQSDRLRADETRAQAQSSNTRGIVAQNQLRGITADKQRSLANRSKYQFEADSEDEAMENEIDDNLEAIHRGAKTLNALGRAMGDELDSQNKHIGRIIGKTDLVDDEIALNRARLERLRK